jgi:hypothetical protein
MTGVSGDALAIAAVYDVWIGNFTDPQRVVVPLGAGLDDVARVGRRAYLDHYLLTAASDRDEDFWRDSIAKREVTRIERQADTRLHPTILVGDPA